MHDRVAAIHVLLAAGALVDGYSVEWTPLNTACRANADGTVVILAERNMGPTRQIRIILASRRSSMLFMKGILRSRSLCNQLEQTPTRRMRLIV